MMPYQHLMEILHPRKRIFRSLAAPLKEKRKARFDKRIKHLKFILRPAGLTPFQSRLALAPYSALMKRKSGWPI